MTNKKRFSSIKIARLVLGTILTVLFIAISIAAISKKESLRCHEVRVLIDKKNNLGFVNDKDILKEINHANHQWIGSRVQDLNVNRIEETIRANEYINKAEVYLNHQGVMNVYIEQKNPMVRIYNNGESYYLSDQWTRIPVSTKFTKRTIHVLGNTARLLDPITSLDSLIVLETKGLLKYIEKNEFWKNAIDQIIIGQNGKIEITLIFADAVIKLGYIHEKLDAKLNKVYNFFKITSQNVPINQYKELDFQFENQVVGTKKLITNDNN